MDTCADRERLAALRVICRSFQPSVDISFVVEQLALDERDQEEAPPPVDPLPPEGLGDDSAPSTLAPRAASEAQAAPRAPEHGPRRLGPVSGLTSSARRVLRASVRPPPSAALRRSRGSS